MRSSKVRLEQIAAPENLREAFLRASKGKGSRQPVIEFRSNLDAELLHLREGLLGGHLSLGKFAAFAIHEPKERRIHAPCFRERVLHHALVDPLEADFERWMIDDTFACRKGKGRERALRRAESFAARYPYFLKLDVSKYFDSIPHVGLLRDLSPRFRDGRVYNLWKQIIQIYATAEGRGLPIGALTSQHLANFYLAKLDRYVKEHLRIRGYVRYMDDSVLWGDPFELRNAYRGIRHFLMSELGLKLNRSATLQPSERGLGFLGYRIFPDGSELSRASRRRFLKKWAWVERVLERGSISEGEAQASITSMLAFVMVAKKEHLPNYLFGRN